MNSKSGTLYIVATPIGNLEDISLRALKILSEVFICAAEDTRKTKILFNHHQIKTKLTSYHKFSERKKLGYLIGLLQDGNDLALVSDAGTPLISDPGLLLVKEAISLGIKITPLPGPSSVTAVTDEGPGKGVILIPREIASLTNRSPGSDINGVPASLTSAKSFPSCSKPIK